MFEGDRRSVVLGHGIHSVKTLKEKSLERILKHSAE
jgi:hypothetical protein